MPNESEILHGIFSQMSKDLSYKVPPGQTAKLIKLEKERELEDARGFTFRYGLLKDRTLGEVVDQENLWTCLAQVKKTTKSKSLKRKIALVAQAKLQSKV